MLNTTLFKKEIKSNYKLLLIFCAVLTMYILVIITMFDPSLGESLKIMSEGMPQLFAAFGMLEMGSTLLSFMVNYLYGFLLVVFPTVFIIILSFKLITRYIDRTGMAYLLASPNKRVKIAVTQALVLIFMIFILTAYATICGIFGAQIMFKGQLEIGKFVLINIGVLGLYMVISGICFMCSCIFSESKYSTGIAVGVNVAFILLNMLSQVGEKLEFLKNFTPFLLFDTAKLMEGEGILGVAVLYAIGIILYAIGIYSFTQKDLSV